MSTIQQEPISSANDAPPPLEERETIPKGSDIWMGGRGARLTPAQKKRIKERCLQRDGSKCMLCGRDEPDHWHDLEIHHVDGNASNHSFPNLQLAHHICNSRDWNQKQYGVHQASSQVKRGNRVLAPQFEPAEVVMNRQYEPLFRRFCFNKVSEASKQKSITSKSDLRIDAREYVGCSQQTSYSYMERLFAKNGPLMECADTFSGELYVRFRDPKDLNLTVADLESKYPKEGRRKSASSDLR